MNILAFFAHPDDETMLCGGILALLDRLGAQVHYLCATHGEGGELGEPPVCTQEQAAEVRSQELACAVQALSGASLTFLDYIDPLVSPEGNVYAYQADFTTLVGQVQTVLCERHIDAILTHGSNGEYGHPAHLLTHKAAVQAVLYYAGKKPQLYTVQASFENHPKPRLANKDDPADLIVDVNGVKEQKTQAALCHRSQHALFIRRPSKELGRLVTVPEVIVTLESLHRMRFDGKEPEGEDALTRLLLESGQMVS